MKILRGSCIILSNCKPRMYADNMHFIYAGSNLENVQCCLNEDLANVFQLATSEQTHIEHDQNMNKTVHHAIKEHRVSGGI